MKRERALLLAEHVIRALDANQHDWPLSLVTELYVCGSFARGALDPHDVDLDVEFRPDERWGSHFATCLAYSRDPYAVASAQAREHLAGRWRNTSPLYRAASAVVADWETRGIDPGTGHLHGVDVRDLDTPYFAGFSLRHFRAIPACLTEHSGIEWTEVVHPTRTRPLDTLRIRPGDRSRLEQLEWG